MERLGFTTRQAQKNKFMAACVATLRRPGFIYDTRFDKTRATRQTVCDGCKELRCGNAAGAFYYRVGMPVAGERKAAWERGDWDATWYCVHCYMKLYGCSHWTVCEWLGFHERASKKAWYTA